MSGRSEGTVPLCNRCDGATVGVEGEGLQAICLGSRFERRWSRWWHVEKKCFIEEKAKKAVTLPRLKFCSVYNFIHECLWFES